MYANTHIHAYARDIVPDVWKEAFCGSLACSNSRDAQATFRLQLFSLGVVVSVVHERAARFALGTQIDIWLREVWESKGSSRLKWGDVYIGSEKYLVSWIMQGIICANYPDSSAVVYVFEAVDWGEVLAWLISNLIRKQDRFTKTVGSSCN